MLELPIVTGSLAQPRIGIADWSIPSKHLGFFPCRGSHLERYATIFNAVEINSSFYRSHRGTTYQRWAASVGDDFRFSVKVPKVASHEKRLLDCNDVLQRFHEEVSELGEKLGAVLLQLPPSLAFAQSLTPMLYKLRVLFGNRVVCEPRHRGWFEEEAEAELGARGIARAGTDPAVVLAAADPLPHGGLAYFRLHGSPRMYGSTYSDHALHQWARKVSHCHRFTGSWIIFDNTAAGAATVDAVRMNALFSAR